MTQATTQGEEELDDRLNNWWWQTSGTGTSSCRSCINGKTICSWHAARLDELQSYIEVELTKARLETAQKILYRGWCLPEMEDKVQLLIEALTTQLKKGE